MTDLVRVASVDHLGERVLRVVFTDGLVRELDFAGKLSGVMSVIDDDSLFAQVCIDPTSRTVSWPNGIDLDPNVLHGDRPPASGLTPRVVREYRMQHSA